MKNKCLLLVLSLILITMLISCNSSSSEDISKTGYNIYYFNQNENELITREVLLDFEDGISRENIIYCVIEALYSGYNTHTLTGSITPIPINVKLNNNIVTLTFEKSYNEVPVTEQMMLRVALIYTLTDLIFIEGVEFFVEDLPLTNSNGDILGIIDKDNIVLTALNPNPTTNYRKINLYFRQEGTNLLMHETREIQVNKDVPIERYIIEELIKGTQLSLLENTLPENTIINYIDTKENVCQVDLTYNRQSKEILSEMGEELFIYSIVNSLTELSTIQKVSFLINGEKQDFINSSIDLTALFERNEELIAKN